MSSVHSPSSSPKLRPLSPFIAKLKVLLSENKYQDAIRWSGNGEAIVIFDADTFKRIVLDKTAEMFKTKNFTSFVRQLNLYGFRKVPTSGKSDPNKNMKFEHPNFTRSKPQMMHLVQRTCPSTKKRKNSILGPFYDEKSRGRSARSAKNTECYTRRNAAWFHDYYMHASTKEGSNETSQDHEQFALDYMYQKFQEEQHAVQLLMYLKYSPPNPQIFPGVVWEPQLNENLYSMPFSAAATGNFSNIGMCHCLSCRPLCYQSTETARQN